MPDEKILPIEELMSQRARKLRELEALGISPYPAGTWKPTHTTREVIEVSSDIKTGEENKSLLVKIAGRMISRRLMGRAMFADVLDSSGRIQVYIKSNSVGDKMYKVASELMDIGDILGVAGHVFRTKTGEITIFASEISVLAKSMRPLPEKWHGIKDPEARYRRRYLDLISTPGAKEIFKARAAIIDSIRSNLKKQNYLEVETPSMQTLAGGAIAKPFVTRHNALGIDLYLRIAPELFLKRLLVGGYEKVFEIGKSFRNEGIDRKHNPEFTMVEIYAAYSDVSDMMTLCEDLIADAAAVAKMFFGKKSETDGDDIFEYDGKKFSVKKPFARVKFFDALKSATNIDFRPALEEGRLSEAAREALGGEIPPSIINNERKILDEVFDKKVLSALGPDPTFITDFPSAFSPLARPRDGDPFIADRFELFIAGEEVANAYSELNDPKLQKEKFLAQNAIKNISSTTGKTAVDTEAAPCDEDYVVALEHGMPPAGGLGIGIDRLVMILTSNPSIREVIIFPTLKPENES